jgi:acetyl-CoA acetyltransferase
VFLTLLLAAAVILMKRSTAIKLGQPILAKYVGSTIAGLAPRIMGIGPSVAIPKLLAQHNISLADIDVVEVNEAFASMAVYCRDKLGLDWAKMNPRGGDRRAADCHGAERAAEDQEEDAAGEHVHWHGTGHGWVVCQRAGLGLGFVC